MTKLSAKDVQNWQTLGKTKIRIMLLCIRRWVYRLRGSVCIHASYERYFIYKLNLLKGLNGTTSGTGGSCFQMQSWFHWLKMLCTKEVVWANMDDILHFGTLGATRWAVNKRKKTSGLHRQKTYFDILYNIDFPQARMCSCIWEMWGGSVHLKRASLFSQLRSLMSTLVCLVIFSALQWPIFTHLLC